MTLARALGLNTDCLSAKRRFETEADAAAFLARPLRSVDGRGNVPTRSYHCRLCDGWHITHQPKRRRRRR